MSPVVSSGWNGDQYLRKLERRVRAVLTKGALDIEADAKLAIETGPKTGRVYRRGGIDHQASAPGEAPASDMGNLANSVYSVPAEKHGSVIRSEAGASAEYAPVLEPISEAEFGSSRIAPRPFLRPAFDRNVPQVVEALKEIG